MSSGTVEEGIALLHEAKRHEDAGNLHMAVALTKAAIVGHLLLKAREEKDPTRLQELKAISQAYIAKGNQLKEAADQQSSHWGIPQLVACALQLVTFAVEKDHQGKPAEAAVLYEASFPHFLRALELQPDASLQARYLAYVDRCRQLGGGSSSNEKVSPRATSPAGRGSGGELPMVTAALEQIAKLDCELEGFMPVQELSSEKSMELHKAVGNLTSLAASAVAAFNGIVSTLWHHRAALTEPIKQSLYAQLSVLRRLASSASSSDAVLLDGIRKLNEPQCSQRLRQLFDTDFPQLTDERLYLKYQLQHQVAGLSEAQALTQQLQANAQKQRLIMQGFQQPQILLDRTRQGTRFYHSMLNRCQSIQQIISSMDQPKPHTQI